jgi:hypothetical protein
MVIYRVLSAMYQSNGNCYISTKVVHRKSALDMQNQPKSTRPPETNCRDFEQWRYHAMLQNCVYF